MVRALPAVFALLLAVQPGPAAATGAGASELSTADHAPAAAGSGAASDGPDVDGAAAAGEPGSAAAPAVVVGGGAGRSPDEALAEARKALATERLDDVLFALQGFTPRAPGQDAEAADILATAAGLSLRKGDRIMALQLCQMALRRDEAHADALAVCTETAQDLNQFDPAEEYVATLRARHPGDVRGHWLDARVAVAQAEWARARDSAQAVLRHRDATRTQKVEARAWAARADSELAQRRDALSEISELTRRFEERQARAARGLASRPSAAATGGIRAGRVVLYKTSWCGYCKKAARFLRSRGVPFVEKDLERDEGAVDELAEKAQRQGVLPRGVPVIDVDGTLIMGYSEPQLARALRRAGLGR